MKSSDKTIIPCFLCGKPIQVKQSKKDKPYFICEPCGLQAFIRAKPGILILRRLLKTIAEKGNMYSNLSQSAYRTLSLTSRLDELRARLNETRQGKSLSKCTPTESDRELAQSALEREISRIRSALSGKH